ncbi:MAG: putative transrane anti-sigma factor [Acidobacteria bacterium]|nr:putative transrane anti-sigma factor [Acidobacteriota bacterium]
MAECDAMRESMPLLLIESLDPANRELAHQHIEDCPACQGEWLAVRQTWQALSDLPEIEPPARIREAFLAEVMPHSQARPANVVPFLRRPTFKWLAQAAAVAIIAGGSYFAGHRTTSVQILPTGAQLTGVQQIEPVSFQTQQQPTYSIAETRVLQADKISPNIEGRPNIENVQFVDSDPSDGKIGVAFDLTSHVTVTGSPADKSMVRLLAYMLEGQDRTSPSRSRAIESVRQAYGDSRNADPEIAAALARVLRNEEHEGVRIRAIDTLKTMSPQMARGDATRDALIEALKNDANPSVRIKAVEALAKMAGNGEILDQAAVDTLRQKASQGDENMYVRVKAAEALSKIRP